MTAQPLPPEDFITPPMGRTVPLARVISSLATPPLMAIAGAAFTANFLHTAAAGWWIATYIAIAVGVPLLYIVWLIKRGVISDFHVRLRSERTRPMVASIIGTLLALLILIVGGAPPLLIKIGIAGFLQTIVLFLITLRWKISAHCTAAGMLAVLTWYITNGVTAVFFTLLVPVVAWARVRLRRHTLAQAMAGTMLGVVILWLTFGFTP